MLGAPLSRIWSAFCWRWLRPIPIEVGLWPQLRTPFADCSQQHSPGWWTSSGLWYRLSFWIASVVMGVSIIGWSSAGLRLVFCWWWIKGHCLCDLKGILWDFDWFSCRSCILALFTWYLNGILLAFVFCLLDYCCLDIVTWISLPYMYVVSLPYQSCAIVIQWFCITTSGLWGSSTGNKSMEI